MINEGARSEKDYLKESAFRHIYNYEFNIGLFQPKKDACEVHAAYFLLSPDESIAQQADFEQHCANVEVSRLEKASDKEEAKENPNCKVIVYDLQAVKQVPCGTLSQFFYKSRLNCFNLTFYDMGTTECNCFFWNESIAMRGAEEIGTCVLEQIKMCNDEANGNDF